MFDLDPAALADDSKVKIEILGANEAEYMLVCLYVLRRTNPPHVVTDEGDVPADVWKPQPARFSRQGLLNALNAGQEASGAVLGTVRALQWFSLVFENSVFSNRDWLCRVFCTAIPRFEFR